MAPPKSASRHPKSSPILIGWREWLCLPDLGISQIKAKIDTGARTSALHAFELEEFTQDGTEMVRFRIHPMQRNNDIVRECIAPISDRRRVTDSGGHQEERIVITSTLQISGGGWPVELTLTSRDTMKFRMLLGRTAMRSRILVDPGASYLLGKKSARKFIDAHYAGLKPR